MYIYDFLNKKTVRFCLELRTFASFYHYNIYLINYVIFNEKTSFLSIFFLYQSFNHNKTHLII